MLLPQNADAVSRLFLNLHDVRLFFSRRQIIYTLPTLLRTKGWPSLKCTLKANERSCNNHIARNK